MTALLKSRISAAPAVGRVVEGNLKERAYADLKRMLLSGSIAPGAFLSERQLADQLGMSKTPVHVALERLRDEGFVDVSPQQGIVVRALSPQEISDHFELREALEPFVVRNVAGRLTAEQIAELRENLRQQARCAHERDVAGTALRDAEFHLLFCRFLGNQLMEQVMLRLRDRIHRVIVAAVTRSPARMPEGVEEHTRIAEAVIDGRGTEAGDLVIKHLEVGKRLILMPTRR